MRDENAARTRRGIRLTFVGFSSEVLTAWSPVRGVVGECEGGVDDDDDEDGDSGKERRERVKRDEYKQTETD